VNQSIVLRVGVSLLVLVALILAAARWRRGDGPPPASSAAAGTRGEPLALVDVIPGKLRARVFSHVIDAPAGPVPCWTFVTDGLLALGQKEIALSVKREPGEAESAYPRGPLALFEVVHGYAARKVLVQEGGSSQLDRARPGLLRDDLHGVLYTPSQSLAGMSAPGPYLTAILLTGPELDAAQQFGMLRMMTRLGEKYRFYPTAPWADLRRAELARPEAMADSFLGRVARLALYTASARQESAPGREGSFGGPGARVVLRLRSAARPGIDEALTKLDADEAVALLLNLDPEADAAMTWTPGQTSPSAIAKPGAKGARIAGNFVVLAPGVDRDGAQGLEDGFSVFLTRASWQKVRAALAQGQPVEVPPSGDLMAFAITWAEETYQNPVDGKAYVAPEGWHTYQPSPGASAAPVDPGGVVAVKGIRLLQPEEEIGQRIETTSLADYIKRIDPIVMEAFGGDRQGTAFDVLVQLEITPPHQAHATVRVQPGSGEATLPPLERRVEAVQAPEVRGGPVRFLIEYAVRGGSKRPAR